MLLLYIKSLGSNYLCQFEGLPDEVDDLLPVFLGGVVQVLLVVHEERD